MFRFFRPVFEIVPLHGFGPVLLGCARNEAREAMAAHGFPLEQSRALVDSFCRGSIQTECDAQERVQFIGARGSPRYIAIYAGHDVFDVAAPELFSRMAARDESGPHTYDATEYLFPNQILTLWHADNQYDLRQRGRRPIWGEVGIGNSAYLAAVAQYGT